MEKIWGEGEKIDVTNKMSLRFNFIHPNTGTRGREGRPDWSRVDKTTTLLKR